MQSTSSRSDALARLPLALALCMALGSIGSCRGLVEVSNRNEPVALPLPAITIPSDADEEWKQLAAAMNELKEAQVETYRARRPALSALAVVNLASSLVLLSGALATAARLRRGLAVLQTGITLSQAYVALGIVVGTWVQLGLAETTQTILGPLRSLEHPVAMQATVAVFQYWLAIPIFVLGMVAQFLFYVWATGLLKNPEVRAALDPETK